MYYAFSFSRPGGPGQMQSVSIENRCCRLHLPSCFLVPFQAETKFKKISACCHSSFYSAVCSHTLINSLLKFPHRFFPLQGFIYFFWWMSSSCLLSWRLLVSVPGSILPACPEFEQSKHLQRPQNAIEFQKSCVGFACVRWIYYVFKSYSLTSAGPCYLSFQHLKKCNYRI